MATELTFEQRLRNVAAVVLEHTEVTRPHNGRGKPPTYAARVDAIAGAARQLAEMVIEYLDAPAADADADAGGCCALCGAKILPGDTGGLVPHELDSDAFYVCGDCYHRDDESRYQQARAEGFHAGVFGNTPF